VGARETVQRSAIAQDHRRPAVLDRDPLELDLDPSDRPLRSATSGRRVLAWKTSAPQDARGFREHRDVVAERILHDLE